MSKINFLSLGIDFRFLNYSYLKTSAGEIFVAFHAGKTDAANERNKAKKITEIIANTILKENEFDKIK